MSSDMLFNDSVAVKSIMKGICIAFLGLTGCVTNNQAPWSQESIQESNSQLIEKSRHDKPLWVGIEPQHFYLAGRQLLFVDRRERVTTLIETPADQPPKAEGPKAEEKSLAERPLTPKIIYKKAPLDQILTQALNHGDEAMLTLLKEQLHNAGASAMDLSSLLPTLKSLTRQSYLKTSQITDIYFEKRRYPAKSRVDSAQELYTIWILVACPKDLTQNILASLEGYLQKNSQTNLADISIKAMNSLKFRNLSH